MMCTTVTTTSAPQIITLTDTSNSLDTAGYYYLEFDLKMDNPFVFWRTDIKNDNGQLLGTKTVTGLNPESISTVFLLFYLQSPANVIIEMKFINLGPDDITKAKIHVFSLAGYTGQVIGEKNDVCVNLQQCGEIVMNIQKNYRFYCKKCLNNKIYNPSQNQCECPEGLGENKLVGLCLPCSQDRYSSNGVCICKLGTQADGKCSLCPEYCKDCDQNGKCTKCQQTNGPDNRPTYRIVSQDGKCICDQTHYNVVRNIICQPCDNKCKTCDQSGQCVTCNDPTIIQSAAPSCSCPIGKYYPSGSGICQGCDVSCAACLGQAAQCDQCRTGYTRDESNLRKCRPCPTNCKECESASTCQVCFDYAIMLHDRSCACPSGIYKFGVCQPSFNCKRLKAVFTKSILTGSEIQLQLTLSWIPPLSTAQYSQFYTVTLPSQLKAQITQSKNSQNPKFTIKLKFASRPPLSAIIKLNLNTMISGSAYLKAGYKNLQGANLKILVRSAKRIL